MSSGTSKVRSLSEAISEYVHNGSHISIGGFTVNRNPMAAVYEIIRQGKKDLHLYAHSNGQGVDELIGGGCVKRLEIAYGGAGRFAPTCIRFKKAVVDGTLEVEDYSNYHMTLRFLAGAMGVPFLPTRSGFGTDIFKLWGFSEETRKESDKLPDQKMIEMENPFGSWGNTEKVMLVPAITPDVTILHVQKADEEGIVRIEGLPFNDIEQAKASKHLIVTCEELVEPGVLRKQSDQNQIPFFCVDAVVHIPMGAYPTACINHYDYDPTYLNNYRTQASDDALHEKYLEKYITGISCQDDLIALCGQDQIEKIKADPETGYATGLDRR